MEEKGEEKKGGNRKGAEWKKIKYYVKERKEKRKRGYRRIIGSF